MPRISTADRVGLTLGEGELVYDTDTITCWFGDGATAGGIEIATGDGMALTRTATPPTTHELVSVDNTEDNVVLATNADAVGRRIRNVSSVVVGISLVAATAFADCYPLQPGEDYPLLEDNLQLFTGDVYAVVATGTANLFVIEYE